MTRNLLRRLEIFYNDIEDPAPYRTKTVAFLIWKNKILSFGVNSQKTDPKQSYWRQQVHEGCYDNFIYDRRHAEVDCLNRAPHNTNLEKCELVVLSKKKNGKFRKARPCPVCSKMIKEMGIKKVWYSTWGNDIVDEDWKN